MRRYDTKHFERHGNGLQVMWEMTRDRVASEESDELEGDGYSAAMAGIRGDSWAGRPAHRRRGGDPWGDDDEATGVGRAMGGLADDRW